MTEEPYLALFAGMVRQAIIDKRRMVELRSKTKLLRFERMELTELSHSADPDWFLFKFLSPMINPKYMRRKMRQISGRDNYAESNISQSQDGELLEV